MLDVAKKRQEEELMITEMVHIFCRKKHKASEGLCKECHELLEYAIGKTRKCPFMEKKTFCSACKVHCYEAKRREEIKEIMRFAGPRILIVHPVITIKHMMVTFKDRRNRFHAKVQKRRGEKI